MNAALNLENSNSFFNGEAFEGMHNKSSKKSGLSRKEKRDAKQYRDARRNKRAF